MSDSVAKAEKKLADMADLAEELAGVGHWRMDVMTEELTWSRNMYRLLNFPEGRQPLLAEVVARIHPADQAGTEERLAHSLSGLAPSSLTRYLMPDGGIRYLESRHTVECDDEGCLVAIFGVTMDVSHRVEVERITRESEHRFRMLAENARDMIACFEWDGTVTYMSPVCTAILGYEPEELVGRKTFEVIHPHDVKRVHQQFQDYVAQGPGAPSERIQYRAIHKDGHTVWVEAHPRAIYDTLTDRLIEIQDVVRDISEQKQKGAKAA